MLARQATSSLRRHTARLSAPSPLIARNLSRGGDIPNRSSKPTVAPPRLNIYRDIWPPLISCVGVALVAYYGLELWRLNLDYKYRLQDMAIEVEVLRAEAEKLRQENEEKNASTSLASKMFGNRSPEGSRSKWFGIF